jgi:DNA-binding GntR family transcriptional regulator
MEFEPPKYARVVSEIQSRIENGTYAPGATLPSEAQLVKEFLVGRTTVVRALQMLQRDGWIDREHGRGTFVRGRPAKPDANSRAGLAVLEHSETGMFARIVHVGPMPAPRVVAKYLGIEPGATAWMRRWVAEQGSAVSELVTCWFPSQLAADTDLESGEPLAVGIREYLRVIRDVRLHRVEERTSARLPTKEEAELLKIKKSAPVLAVVAGVYGFESEPLGVVDMVMPGELHELEDSYLVS